MATNCVQGMPVPSLMTQSDQACVQEHQHQLAVLTHSPVGLTVSKLEAAVCHLASLPACCSWRPCRAWAAGLPVAG